jgi:mRNA interferase MazF
MARAGYVPARGDFVRVVLDPRVGREQSGERPALVLSDREFNDLTGYVFAAPITSNARGWPFEVPIPPGARVAGVVLADQTKSIDYVARYVRRIGEAPGGLVELVLAQVTAILAY